VFTCWCSLAGVRRADFRRAGVWLAGFRRTGFRCAGFRCTGVRRAGVRRAGVQLAGVRRADFRRAGFHCVAIRSSVRSLLYLMASTLGLMFVLAISIGVDGGTCAAIRVFAIRRGCRLWLAQALALQELKKCII